MRVPERVNLRPLSEADVDVLDQHVLSEVGLVQCRAEGRHRYYRLDRDHLRPLDRWLAKYQERLDRLEDYLSDLRQGEEHQ
jgi:DNA-binding transcriptional ArsR family regulator